MTADDLAEYSAEWVEPISTTYRDWTVYELPPNGDGMAALEMLNIMEQFPPDPAGPHSAAELHTRIEAMKLAYADVKAYDGDPRFGKIPVEQLLSKEFAAKRAALIDPAKANCTVAPGALGASDTTYLLGRRSRRQHPLHHSEQLRQPSDPSVTVRGHGLRAAEPRRPVLARSANRPTRLPGRKRPFHTIIPAFMQHGDQHIGFGIMGGMNQPLAHAQFVSNVVDYHMNIQAAMEEPRFTVSRQARLQHRHRVARNAGDRLTR